MRLLLTFSILLARCCFLVLENAEEVNIKLMQGSSVLLAILTAYLLSGSFTFDEFLLYFSAASTLHSLIVVFQMLKGEVRDLKEGMRRLLSTGLPALTGVFIFLASTLFQGIELYLYLSSLAFNCFQIWRND
jgi:hypothetical protein